MCKYGIVNTVVLVSSHCNYHPFWKDKKVKTNLGIAHPYSISTLAGSRAIIFLEGETE